jgi:hypothetical protein
MLALLKKHGAKPGKPKTTDDPEIPNPPAAADPFAN